MAEEEKTINKNLWKKITKMWAIKKEEQEPFEIKILLIYLFVKLMLGKIFFI